MAKEILTLRRGMVMIPVAPNVGGLNAYTGSSGSSRSIQRLGGSAAFGDGEENGGGGELRSPRHRSHRGRRADEGASGSERSRGDDEAPVAWAMAAWAFSATDAAEELSFAAGAMIEVRRH